MEASTLSWISLPVSAVGLEVKPYSYDSNSWMKLDVKRESTCSVFLQDCISFIGLVHGTLWKGCRRPENCCHRIIGISDHCHGLSIVVQTCNTVFPSEITKLTIDEFDLFKILSAGPQVSLPWFLVKRGMVWWSLVGSVKLYAFLAYRDIDGPPPSWWASMTLGTPVGNTDQKSWNILTWS